MKIDFVFRNDQEGFRGCHDVAKLAAKHHLIVDFQVPRSQFGALVDNRGRVSRAGANTGDLQTPATALLIEADSKRVLPGRLGWPLE